MNRASILPLILAAPLLLAAPAATELSWDQLIPTTDVQLPVPPPSDEGSQELWASPAPEAYGVVADLDGQTIKIPGFIVPLESDEGGLLNEFFLVPYFGACIHVPPPPPNQIVYVTVADAFNLETMWEPFWIEGTLRTKSHVHAIGASAYSLEGTKIYPYEY
jgi:hypothetical protein